MRRSSPGAPRMKLVGEWEAPEAARPGGPPATLLYLGGNLTNSILDAGVPHGELEVLVCSHRRARYMGTFSVAVHGALCLVV